jgi:hypothetical protein
VTTKTTTEEIAARHAASAPRLAEAADRRSLIAVAEVGQVAGRVKRLERDLLELRRVLWGSAPTPPEDRGNLEGLEHSKASTAPEVAEEETGR